MVYPHIQPVTKQGLTIQLTGNITEQGRCNSKAFLSKWLKNTYVVTGWMMVWYFPTLMF